MTSINFPTYFFTNARQRGVQVNVLTGSNKWQTSNEWQKETCKIALGVQIIDTDNNINGVFNCSEFNQVFGELESDRDERVISISNVTNRTPSYYSDWSDQELEERFEALSYEN